LVKLVDIAKAAQVSKAAVSYAFSSDPEKRAKLSAATLERILQTARQFNYRPSLTGRGFAKRRSYNIALLMPVSCTRNMSGHYLGMFHGVSSGIAGSDYNLSVFFGCDEKFFSSVNSGRVDGVAVLARRNESAVFGQLAKLSIPVVYLNRPAPYESDNVSSCCSDYRNWIEQVLNGFSMRGIKDCRLYYRPDRCGDLEAERWFRFFAPEHKFTACSFKRDEFATLECTAGCGFIFLGSSPEILDFIRKHPDADYMMISESEQLLRYIGSRDKLFYHDSEPIGRAGVEILLDMLERNKKSEAKFIPLLNYGSVAPKESLIPEF